MTGGGKQTEVLFKENPRVLHQFERDLLCRAIDGPGGVLLDRHGLARGALVVMRFVKPSEMLLDLLTNM